MARSRQDYSYAVTLMQKGKPLYLADLQVSQLHLLYPWFSCSRDVFGFRPKKCMAVCSCKMSKSWLHLTTTSSPTKHIHFSGWMRKLSLYRNKYDIDRYRTFCHLQVRKVSWHSEFLDWAVSHEECPLRSCSWSFTACSFCTRLINHCRWSEGLPPSGAGGNAHCTAGAAGGVLDSGDAIEGGSQATACMQRPQVQQEKAWATTEGFMTSKFLLES